MTGLKEIEIARNRKGMITRFVVVLAMICCTMFPLSGGAIAQQQEDDDDELTQQAPSCGAIFGVKTLFPGEKCCYIPLSANFGVSYTVDVNPNTQSPKAKIKFFRNGQLILKTKFTGQESFTFSGQGLYQVCIAYPIAQMVDGGPSDFMNVTLTINNIN